MIDIVVKTNKRITGIHKVLILFMFFFCQKNTSGQELHNQRYLSEVGVFDSLYSEILMETRDIFVHLPVSYSNNKNQKYPVVYILDGDVLLPAVNIVHDFYYGGFMPEMVLVGISNSNHRTRDLTISIVDTRFGMPFNEENGKADTFLKFIETELIPHIEQNYPATNYRTLIGHSYGGLFTVHTLLNNPNLFANYLSIDPSLDWDNQQILKQAKTELSKSNFTGKSLFMSLSGQLHMQNPEITIDNVMQDSSDFTLFARSNIAFSEIVNQNPKSGLSYAWKFYPRDLHGTIPLPSIMDGLLSFFEWYQMENTDKFNSPDTPKEELLSIVKYRANKLEQNFNYPVAPYPEDLFDMLGYMNLSFEDPEKAKMFFECAIEYYPESVSAYSSMAEFYELQKDTDKAVEYLSKAYEMSSDETYKQKIAALKGK